MTNWSSYYKLGQPLLQNSAAITNWGKIYYKLGQVLQIRAIITNWVIRSVKHVMHVKKITEFCYLNCENGKYLASIMDDSAIMCDEVIDVYIETNFDEKKAACKKQNFYILLAFLFIATHY